MYVPLGKVLSFSLQGLCCFTFQQILPSAWQIGNDFSEARVPYARVAGSKKEGITLLLLCLWTLK